jgi:prepilin-type N-terminal cleavage/methylation domain-containing protein
MQLNLMERLMSANTFKAPRRSRSRGFTLVEISIVLVIIGLILGGILNAQSVIRNAQTKDSIKALNDMAAAARQFQDRYGMWPGDYSNGVLSLGATCANGSGNGKIDTPAEALCATEHLIRAGMLKGTPGSPLTLRGLTFSVTSATTVLTGLSAASFPAPNNWGNVVRVQGIDCDVAVQMDRAVDDGNTHTGNFRTDAAQCGNGTVQTETAIAPVAKAVVVWRLN